VETRQLIELAVESARKKKSGRIVVMDMRGLSPAADYFFITSAASTRQVQAIVDEIAEKLAKDGVKPTRVEGQTEGRWVVLDYIDVFIHVFLDEARDYYSLESLWGDAPRVLELEAEEEGG